MNEPVSQFTLTLEQVRDYELRLHFDKPELADLIVDEPPPLGRNAGPNPARLLAAAIASCLTASFVFCARKSRLETGPLRAEVSMEIVRNENKRLRVGRVKVTIDPALSPADLDRARRCREIFEDFCTVTQSIRQGVNVEIEVKGLD